MAGRPPPAQEAGRAERDRAGADRGQIGRGRAQPADLADEGLVGDGLGHAEAAGHAEHVAAVDVGQSREAREGQAVGAERQAADAGQDHLRARQANEELLRAGEIEGGDAGIEGEDDAGHGGLLAVDGRFSHS